MKTGAIAHPFDNAANAFLVKGKCRVQQSRSSEALRPSTCRLNGNRIPSGYLLVFLRVGQSFAKQINPGISIAIHVTEIVVHTILRLRFLWSRASGLGPNIIVLPSPWDPT
jgi:hypothetical protein